MLAIKGQDWPQLITYTLDFVIFHSPAATAESQFFGSLSRGTQRKQKCRLVHARFPRLITDKFYQARIK